MTIHQFISTLFARRRIIGATVLTLFVLLILMIMIVPARYTAEASVLVNAQSKDPIGRDANEMQLGEAFVTTQADIISSPRVARAVVEKLNLTANPSLKAAWQKDTDGRGDEKAWIADVITAGLKVTSGRESNVVDIKYVSKDPKDAAVMANAFAQAYLETSSDLKIDPVKQSARFFDARISEIRDQLAAAQARLSAASKELGVVVTPERLDVENARLADLSSQLAQAQSQQADSSSRDLSARGKIASSPDVMQNPVVQQLKTQVALAESKLKLMAMQLGPNHPQYIQAQQELADLKRSLAAETAQVGNSLAVSSQIGANRVAQIEADTAAQRQRIIDLGQKRDQLSVLQREVDSDQKAYDLVMQRYSETSIESHVAQSDVSLLTPAAEPTNPSFPKIKLYFALTAVIGLLLGAGTALLIEIVNPVIHSPLDVIEQIGVPVFAVIPWKSRGIAHRRFPQLPFFGKRAALGSPS